MMAIMLKKCVRALIINNDKELLLIQLGHLDQPYWHIAGGTLEKGESPKEALVREIWEETGLKDIEIGPQIGYGVSTTDYNKTIMQRQHRFFVVRTSEKTLKPGLLTEWEQKNFLQQAWFSADKIPESLYPKALRPYLPDILFGKYPPEPLEIDMRRQ